MKSFAKSNKQKMITAFAALFILVFSTAFVSISKKAKFPQPSGQYGVGTFLIEMEDTSRHEALGGMNDYRQLLVQFYYPSTASGKTKVPYTPHPEQLEKDINALYGIPVFMIKKLSRSEVPVAENGAPVKSDGLFPLLIFSHGWDGSRFQNSFQLTELASQGYIVASIEHSYSAAGTVFPDGSKGATIPFNKVNKDDAFSQLAIREWSADQRFVLDQIMALDKEETFALKGLINFDRVGVFGHSFGGATAATTLTVDSRFKAGINLDGFYFGDGYQTGFSQPFMELRAENKSTAEMSDADLKEWNITRERYQWLMFEEWNKRITSFAKNGFESFTLLKSNHMSFSDFTLVMPLQFITAPHVKEHHAIVNRLTLAFFDHHLKGVQTDLQAIAGEEKLVKPN